MSSSSLPDIETNNELRVSFDAEDELDSALAKAEAFAKKHEFISWTFLTCNPRELAGWGCGYILAKKSDGLVVALAQEGHSSK